MTHAFRQAAEELGDDGAPLRRPKCWGCDWITTADLMSQTQAPTWLVKRVMVAGQPLVIGAPQKAGKTCVAIDLALSLAAGTPFLGYFETYRPVRVAMISGESGRWTIMNHARQVCQARSIDPETAKVVWQFDLPQLPNPAHLAALAEGVRREGVEVVIIDPLYLCLLSGAADLQASNLYHVGPLLLNVARACLDAGATPVMLHHTNRPAGAKRDPLELGDLAFSGIAEFARQWLLMNRREPFVAGEPSKLWLSVGGSCGQGGEWAVDVDEGTLGDDFTGRRWDVTVTPRGNALEQQRAERQERKAVERQKEQESKLLRAMDALALERKPATLRAIRERAALSGAKAADLAERLIEEGLIEEVEVEVKRGRKGQATAKALRRTIDDD
jgi:hypothetical protein